VSITRWIVYLCVLLAVGTSGAFMERMRHAESVIETHGVGVTICDGKGFKVWIENRRINWQCTADATSVFTLSGCPTQPSRFVNQRVSFNLGLALTWTDECRADGPKLEITGSEFDARDHKGERYRGSFRLAGDGGRR